MLKLDYEEIKKRYKYLKKLDKYTNGKCEDIKDSLDNYKCLLKKDKSNVFNEKLYIPAKRLESDFYDFLFSENPSIAKTLIMFIKEYAKNYSKIILKDYKYQTICIKDNDLKNYSYQLFSYLRGEFCNLLDFIYEECLIELTPIKNYFNSNLYALTYLDSYNRLGYAVVANYQNIELFSTVNHELTHIMEIILNKNLHSENNYLLSEARTTFIDLLSSYKILKNTKDEKIKTDATYSIANRINISIYSLVFSYIYEYLESFNIKDKHQASNKIKEITFDNNLYSIDKIMNNQASYSLKDFYSFLVAIHLFNSYLLDEDKGIYLFNKSMKNCINNKEKYLFDLEFKYDDIDFLYDLYSKYTNLTLNKIRTLK